MLHKDLDRIFHPHRVAVAGVSTEGFGFGRGIFLSLLSMGFEGELIPVNPRGGEILGRKLYRSIDEIPGSIDFAVIAVAAAQTPETLEQCRIKGALGAEIISSGFRELGTPEGIALENEIRAIARKGIRVIGPNCFGIYCPRSGLTMLPGPDLSREAGPVAFISQSGGMSIDFAFMGPWTGVHFSKMISFGNGADLRETELLEYFRDDDETGIVSLYVEGVEDGERFIRALRETSVVKPVVVYKGWLSEAGQRAVTSHTASLGGSRVIWEAALRQAGAIQVQSLEEMAQTCLAFSLLPHRVYRGITVAGGGGALGVAACDMAEAYGLSLPHLEGDVYEAVLSCLPKPGSSAANPIDIANPYVPPRMIREALIQAAKDERVDIQIQAPLLYHFKALSTLMGVKSFQEITPYPEMATAAREVTDITGKPVLVVLPNPRRGEQDMDVEELLRRARRAFLEKGIPVFDTLSDAMRAIHHVSAYAAAKLDHPFS